MSMRSSRRSRLSRAGCEKARRSSPGFRRKLSRCNPRMLPQKVFGPSAMSALDRLHDRAVLFLLEEQDFLEKSEVRLNERQHVGQSRGVQQRLPERSEPPAFQGTPATRRLEHIPRLRRPLLSISSQRFLNVRYRTMFFHAHNDRN